MKHPNSENVEPPNTEHGEIADNQSALYADITWRDDGQPLSRVFDDVYFSSGANPQEGLEESRYVFLQQNHLAERFRTLRQGDTFTIGETGFGTGLNFLATWALWHQSAPAGTSLHFISVEKYPLHHRDLARALHLWPQLHTLCSQLLERYPPLTCSGVHRLHFGPVRLTLVIGDASAALESLRLADESRDRTIDAWFLDGFAPAKNPAMWTPELFHHIAALSRPAATFATFTCAGIVKRGMTEAGFALEKVPGFGRKREVLRGLLETITPPAVTTTPWHLPAAAHSRTEACRARTHIAVIGAGIAGATSARALAERGHKVSVFEQSPGPAGGASGNERGILYAKLSPKPGPNGDFNLHALMFAQRYYRERCAGAVHFDGLLQLAQSEKETALQGQTVKRLQAHGAEALARHVDASEAGEIAGLPLNFGGLYFPQAGWLQPGQVCAALLAHNNIELHCNTRIESLESDQNGWLLHSAPPGRAELQLGNAPAKPAHPLPGTPAPATGPNGALLADAVVLCTANAIRGFAQTSALPLSPIRGQVSGTEACALSQSLTTTLCGEGYITPAHRGRHSFGATFKLKQSDTSLRDEEHRENLQTLGEILPQVARAFSTGAIDGRAALRAATPDYLPMAGPVPSWDSIDTTYTGLRKNRKQLIAQRASYQPNLYVLGGLGSRGFTYAPLAAELLAGWICGEVMPVSAALMKALHPARFAIRDLGKNR